MTLKLLLQPFDAGLQSGWRRSLPSTPNDLNAENRRALGYLEHAGIIALFAGLGIVFTWPAFLHPFQAIPGAGGDNLFFLWDLWRSQQALDAGDNPFYTQLILYPHRLPLFLHTHTVLHAAILYPFGKLLGLAATYNLWAWLSLAVGGWGAYLLGMQVSGSRPGALFAAFVFTFSPYRMAHLQGHMNLVSAHWLPFFVLCLIQMPQGRPRHALGAGIFLGLTLWTDLNYALHLGVLTLFTAGWWLHRYRRQAFKILWKPALLALLAVSGVLLPLLAAGAASGIAGAADADSGIQPPADQSQWFSARVVDFLRPPALQPLWGQAEHDNAERQVYLGYAVLALCVLAWKRCREEAPGVRFWLGASLLLALLSMGPYLMFTSRHTVKIGQTTYNLPLPQALLQQIPGFGQARCPARFMGLGMLAIGILAGFGMRQLVRNRSNGWAAGAVLLTTLEFLPAPYPVTPVIPPGSLAQLAARGGTVLDLPLAAGSYLHWSGQLDFRSNLYQTAHGLPRVGGLVARCSDRFRVQLCGEPLIGELLNYYSSRDAAALEGTPDPAALRRVVERYGIRHLLVLPGEVQSPAYRYVRRLFPDAREQALEDGGLWIQLE